jgi:PDZ domain-containing protein
MVAHVDPNGPSADLLKSGDRIVRLDGKPVVTSIDLIHTVSSLPPGSRITLGVRRNNLPHLVKLVTGPPTPGDDLHRSRIGVDVNTPHLKVTLPHKVNIATDNVVGPSAGLAFALAIFDAVSEVDLIRGRYVVATGELTLEGQVLAVGGVRQKAIAAQDDGAELIMVPRGNVQEAREAISDFCKPGGEKMCAGVVGVSSAKQAIELLSLPAGELAAKLANA